MGMYDTIRVGDREGQVKLWDCVLHDYARGDEVMAVNEHDVYSIAMREGGYVIVVDNIIVNWHDAPLAGYPIYDKWGEELSDASGGIFGESYAFDDWLPDLN